jgi:hypothetical protein
MMNPATKILNQLATKYVGDGKSMLCFVTDDDGTIAVFHHQFVADAKKLADSFHTPCWVEDRNGVCHDNKASERRSREEGD